MELTVRWNGKDYNADTGQPIHISIPLKNGLEYQPNAFGAPLYEASPVRAGDFVGALEHGSPVNFYNVRVNPHGNGTHTECIGHIVAGEHYIHEKLSDIFCVAELVTVYPELTDNGDRVISAQLLEQFVEHKADALIVRTMPNDEGKLTRKYTGTEPPYFLPEAIEWIVDRGIRHLLIDLPSVDPEVDGGAVKSHKMYWGLPKSEAHDRTITEMIFVDNGVNDGLYLLNLQIAPLMLDASPSRPIIFKLNGKS